MTVPKHWLLGEWYLGD